MTRDDSIRRGGSAGADGVDAVRRCGSTGAAARDVVNAGAGAGAGGLATVWLADDAVREGTDWG